MALRMKSQLFSMYAEARWEPVAPRVRAWLGERLVLETTSAAVFWEPRRMVPVYAVPRADLRDAEVRLQDPQPDVPDLGALPPFLGPEDFASHTMPGDTADLVVNDRVLASAAFVPDDPDLDGMVALEFGALDRWQVEDTDLVGHPHDPFKRIDVLDSHRRVVVSLDGQVLADSTHAKALCETHLPVRWYLPREDVRHDLLEESTTRSTCAYKGVATYLSLGGGGEAGRDVAWTYPDPLDDATRVRDYVCFWAERTDLEVDGTAVHRPVTPWSPPEVLAATPLDSLELG